MTLKISDSVVLPDDAVTQTFGCIGRRGAGKTYLAGVLAEQMLDIHAQVIVIDPVGNWYGLRVAADGKSKGKDIFVIGGQHGDVPITPDSGAQIARLLVERSASAVLDLSNFRQGERKRFAADFGEEFFHLKKTQRSPVHLFIEEAQLFIPQRSGPDEARMLGAFENIIRLGRNYGIGATCITQRPQSVNKEVLSQIECLCVLQVNGTHERKALEDWVQEAGADRKLVGELPGLGRGEGYVWSPAWLRIFKRVRFAKKTTFDASATPEVGRTVKAALLSSVDVERLKADLTAVIKQAEADDPKALKRRIAQLEKEAGAVHSGVGIDVGEHNREVNQLHSTIDAVRLEGRSVASNGVFHLEKLEKMAAGLVEELASARDLMEGFLEKRALALKSSTPVPQSPAPPRAKPTTASPGTKLPEGEHSILRALAQYPNGLSRPQTGAITGYTKISTRNTYIQRLQQKGYAQTFGDVIRITSTGFDAVGDFEPLPTGSDLFEWWLSRLPEGEGKILKALYKPSSLSRDDISRVTGYEAVSTRNTYIQRLAQKMLVVVSGNEVRISDTLR